jgi:hypothetical protein
VAALHGLNEQLVALQFLPQVVADEVSRSYSVIAASPLPPFQTAAANLDFKSAIISVSNVKNPPG